MKIRRWVRQPSEQRSPRNYQPLRINRALVERVDIFRYLSVYITQDLSWYSHVSTLMKKACQHLYHLRHLRDFSPWRCWRLSTPAPYRASWQAASLSGLGAALRGYYLALQKVVCSAECTIRCQLSALWDIYTRICRMRAERIIKDHHHPNNKLLSLLRSGRHYRCLKAKTERMRRSFFPQAIQVLNQWLSLHLHNS